MPKAIRLSHLSHIPGKLRSAIRAAMDGMWQIEGQKGIFFYVQGCKADHTTDDGIVAELECPTVAGPTQQFAIFKRDEAVEFVVKQAMGLEG